MYPYYALTYNPTPFQPPVTAANASGFATCLGFEEYAPQHYQCTPYGYNGFDNCWKCPPKVGAPGLGSVARLQLPPGGTLGAAAAS